MPRPWQVYAQEKPDGAPQAFELKPALDALEPLEMEGAEISFSDWFFPHLGQIISSLGISQDCTSSSYS
jgi:hypothetical protein